MNDDQLNICARILPPHHSDVLNALMSAYISIDPKANFYSTETFIEREFTKWYGCSINAVPVDKLAHAVDELCRILYRLSAEKSNIYELKDSFFRNLMRVVGSGVSTTQPDDVVTAACLVEDAYQEDVFRFLMRANSLTKLHQLYSNNEAGIRINQANTESNVTSNYANVAFGSSMSNEQALVYAQKYFRTEPYCLVRDWLWVDLQFSEATQASLKKHMVMPNLIYAHTIIHDSQQRWQKDSYLRSPLLKAHENTFHFRTDECVYLLLGSGVRISTTAEIAAGVF